MRRTRLGFTLMELMIVIGIILLLVAMTIPVIGMIRKQAKEALCRNNFQQLGIGITAYRNDNNNLFPTTLTLMFDAGQTLQGEPKKILLCPFDTSKGGPTMNRQTAWGMGSIHETNCSYFYEVNNDPTKWTFDEAHNNGNWPYDQTWWIDASPKPDTWAKAKVLQLLKGNKNGALACAFRQSDFPILRCYWHYPWPTATTSTDNVKKVFNLAWDMSVFWSIPYWEHQINPTAFPL